jgi:hypothetical protein
MNRNVSQKVKQQIRNEVKKELENAVRLGVVNGSIVTSRGDVAYFTFQGMWTLQDGSQVPIIYVKRNKGERGERHSSINDVARTLMYQWGYTKWATSR